MSAHYDIKVLRRWLTRPLCVRYVAGVFRSNQINVLKPAEASTLAVHWGLGYLLDGEREVFGAWPTSDPSSTLAPQVLEDLQLRGVLRIRTLTGRCVAGLANEASRGALSRIRGQQVLPWEGETLAKSVEVRTLPTQIADLILAADRLADQIQSRLTAAVTRRRPFADRAAAMNFVAAELYRADRQLWGRPAPIQAIRLHAQDAAPAVYH